MINLLLDILKNVTNGIYLLITGVVCAFLWIGVFAWAEESDIKLMIGLSAWLVVFVACIYVGYKLFRHKKKVPNEDIS